MRKTIYFIILLLMMASCRSIPQPKSEDVIIQVVHDSIAVRDSIYVENTSIIREKGDTVYVEKTSVQWRERWRDKEVAVHDTTTIREVVTVEVEKDLSGWQVMWMQIGKIFGVLMFLALIGVISYYLAKRSVKG